MQELLHKRTTHVQHYDLGVKDADGRQIYTAVVSSGQVFKSDLQTRIDHTYYEMAGKWAVFNRLAGDREVWVDTETMSYVAKDAAGKELLSYQGPKAKFEMILDGVVHYLNEADGLEHTFNVTTCRVRHEVDLPDQAALAKFDAAMAEFTITKLDEAVRVAPVAFLSLDGREVIASSKVAPSDADGKIQHDVDLSKVETPCKGDPTATITSSAEDGWFDSDSGALGAWGTAQAGNNVTVNSTNPNYVRFGSNGNLAYADATWYANIGVHVFDLSSLTGATASGVSWKVTPAVGSRAGAEDHTAYFCPGTHTIPLSASQAEFQKYTTTDLGHTLYSALTFDESEQTIAGTAAAVTHVQSKIGGSMVITNMDEHQRDNTAPPATDNSVWEFRNVEHGQGTKCVITYTLASGRGASGMMLGLW